MHQNHMTTKTMSSGSNQHHKSKLNPLLDWYQRTTGSLVDRMCCVSYSSQVDDDEEPMEYDEMRAKAKMVVPEWIQDYKHDKEQQRVGHTRKEHGPGHLILQGNFDEFTGRCYYSPYSPGRSDATATTVSMSTIRTARTLASESTLNTSNRSGDEIVVDDIVYVMPSSLDDRATKTPQEIDIPPASRYRSVVDERRESPPLLKKVASDALPNLPYLSSTEGYEC